MDFETIEDLFEEVKLAEESDAYLFVYDKDLKNVIVALTLEQFIAMRRKDRNDR